MLLIYRGTSVRVENGLMLIVTAVFLAFCFLLSNMFLIGFKIFGA